MARFPTARRFLLAACLAIAAGAAGAARAAQDQPVSIAVGARIEGGELRIDGRASVPDGAWIIYAAHLVRKPETRGVGYALVRDGRFTGHVRVAGWPAGEIEVDAHFQTLLPAREQPDAVIERYGEKGERMTGPAVVQGGAGYRTAVASTRVAKR